MNFEEYKNITNRPDAFQRNIIEASKRELVSMHPPSASLLQGILKGEPISKPNLHNGNKDTDYFVVKLNIAEAEQIVEYLLDAEANAVGRNGKTTPQASHFASLVDAWVQYIDFLDRR